MKIVERGWGGHFICADRCTFRRNTLLDGGDRKIVVSTVGGMTDREFGIETIAHERYYETMAFEAKFDDPYWEADVTQQLDFDSEWSICGGDKSELPDGVDNIANNMHETVVAELSKLF